jgi:hypothetical protein
VHIFVSWTDEQFEPNLDAIKAFFFLVFFQQLTKKITMTTHHGPIMFILSLLFFLPFFNQKTGEKVLVLITNFTVPSFFAIS